MSHQEGIDSTVKFSTTYINGLPYLNTEPTTIEEAEHRLGNNPEVLCSLEIENEEDKELEIAMNKIFAEENETEEFTSYINYLSQYDMNSIEAEECGLVASTSTIKKRLRDMGKSYCGIIAWHTTTMVAMQDNTSLWTVCQNSWCHMDQRAHAQHVLWGIFQRHQWEK